MYRFQYLVVALFLATAGAQNAKVVKTPSPRQIVAIDGKTIFHEYCASCHGVDGKGSGPVAVSLKQRPTDLTQISRRNNGRFPDERMMRILRGSETLSSHGTQEMPVWGPVFYGGNGSLSVAQERVHSLLDYLERIQEK